MVARGVKAGGGGGLVGIFFLLRDYFRGHAAIATGKMERPLVALGPPTKS